MHLSLCYLGLNSLLIYVRDGVAELVSMPEVAVNHHLLSRHHRALLALHDQRVSEEVRLARLCRRRRRYLLVQRLLFQRCGIRV